MSDAPDDPIPEDPVPDDPTEMHSVEHSGDVSPKLIEALICPATGGKLEHDRERGELISRRAHLAYPIRSGIPIMLIGEARQLDL